MGIAEATEDHAALYTLRGVIKRAAEKLQFSILTLETNDPYRIIFGEKVRKYDQKVKCLDKQIEEIETAHPSLRQPDDDE